MTAGGPQSPTTHGDVVDAVAYLLLEGTFGAGHAERTRGEGLTRWGDAKRAATRVVDVVRARAADDIMGFVHELDAITARQGAATIRQVAERDAYVNAAHVVREGSAVMDGRAG